MDDRIDVLRRYLRAVEEFAPREVLEEFFTADAVQDEFPNRLFASGRRHDLSTMMNLSEKGATVLSAQRYVLKNAVCHAGEVAAEIEWTGVLCTAFGSLNAGDSLRAAIGMFFTFRGTKIASIRNYDCYYPF